MPPLPDVDMAAARTFVAVVEAGGISPAARRLGLAKSVVSGRIAALERSVGASLFARGSRLVVTDHGHRFYEGIRAVLADLDALVGAVTHGPGTYAGRLRIAAPAGLGRKHLGTLLCGFLAEHPGLRAEIDYADHYVDIVGGGYDLALRIGQPTSSDLVGRRLGRIRRLACASPAYLARHGAPSSVDELAGHGAIGYGLVEASGQWLFATDDPARPRTVTPPRFVLLANNGEAMRDAALAGLGIAVLPSFFVAEDVAHGSLVALDLGQEAVGVELWALHPHRRESRPILAALAGRLASEIGDPPFWERVLRGRSPRGASDSTA